MWSAIGIAVIIFLCCARTQPLRAVAEEESPISTPPIFRVRVIISGADNKNRAASAAEKKFRALGDVIIAEKQFHLTFRIVVVDLSEIHKRPLYTGTITATVAAPQATPPGHALNEIYVNQIAFIGQSIDDLLDELIAFADQRVLKGLRTQWAK